MNVLVSDTSIIIDLERSSLLREAFALPVQFVVPDLLYERELRDHGGPGLIDLGLRVESLEEADVQRAQHYRLANSRLALPRHVRACTGAKPELDSSHRRRSTAFAGPG